MEKIRILDLVLKACWYDMIEDGYKREEYRAITPYWCNRILHGVFDEPYAQSHWSYLLHSKKPDISLYTIPTHIRFRRGYTNKSMLFKIDNIEIGLGKSDLGSPVEEVFIIKFS